MLTAASSMSIASSSSCSSSSSILSSINNYHHHHHPRRISLVNNLHPRLKNNGRKQRFISCELAVKSNPVDSISSSSSSKAEIDEDELNQSKVGSRVRVKVPLKVYHVPKIPEVDITGMEGNIKQYVGIWKGHRISANLPFKVEFFKEIEGRGPVKVIAHLKEDEFEYIDDVEKKN